jgi:uncharacterized membrane protein YedE/YeeE
MTISLIIIAAGGTLLGAGGALIALAGGRVAGVSALLRGALEGARGDRAWRWSAVAGIIAAGALAARLAPETVPGSAASPGLLIAAGLLVGAGARIGNGCTSGHGVCGVGRASPRSIFATIVFCAVGALVVTAARLF